MVIYNAAVARRLERIFDEDLRHSQRVDYRAWKKRGFRERLLELFTLPLRNLL